MRVKTAILVLGFILITYSQSLYSQNNNGKSGKGKITGKLIDADANTPLASGSVTLLKQKDSTIVGGAITDKNGDFTISNVAFSKYFIKINYLGYQPKRIKEVFVTKDEPVKELGTIALKVGSEMLDEVVVSAERPMIEYGVGKKIINVDKNISAAGGNALDILKNVPSVEVDVDGNVSLRGSQSVNILIDGKPSTLTSAGSSLLEQLPANNIDHLEIITNPSAKYEAEGSAGIINIITKNEKDPGLNGVVSINAGTPDRYSASANLNYKLPGFNLFGSYDFSSNHGGMDGISNSQAVTRDSVNQNMLDTNNLNQNIMRRRYFYNHSVKGGLEYTINKLSSIMFSSVYRWRYSENIGDVNSINKTFGFLNTQSFIDDKKNVEIEKNPAIDLSLNYKLQFDKKGHELTADAFFTTSKDDENTNYTKSFINPSGVKTLQNSDNLEKNKYFVIQSDYSQPFDNSGKLETGVKSSWKEFDANYTYLKFIDSTNSWLFDPLSSNHYVYDELIIAAYGIFTGKYDNLTYSAGLRIEETNTKGNLIGFANQPITNNYLDFFPSASLNYKLTDMQEIQFIYSRRINRPRNGQLNPFIDKSDDFNWRYGNPDLKPEYINSFDLGYIYNFPKFTITPGVFYKFTNDVMTHYQIIGAASGTEINGDILPFGKRGNTWMNEAKSETYGLEFTFSGDILPWLKTNGDISYYKYFIYGSAAYAGQTSSDYSWNGRLTLNFIPMKGLSFQASGNYSAESVTLQGKRFPNYAIDAGGRYDITDALALTLRGSDIFHTRRFHVMSNITSAGIISSQSDFNMLPMSQSFSIGIQYKINEGIKQKDKKKNGGDNGNGGGMDDYEQ